MLSGVKAGGKGETDMEFAGVRGIFIGVSAKKKNKSSWWNIISSIFPKIVFLVAQMQPNFAVKTLHTKVAQFS